MSTEHLIITLLWTCKIFSPYARNDMNFIVSCVMCDIISSLFNYMYIKFSGSTFLFKLFWRNKLLNG